MLCKNNIDINDGQPIKTQVMYSSCIFFFELHIWMSVLYSIFYFFERSARLGLPRAAGKKKKNACQFIFNNVHLLCCLVIEDNAENNFLQAVKWDHLTCRRVVLSGSPAWHNWTVKVRLSGRMCCCLFYFTVSTLWLCHEATGPFGSNEYVKKKQKNVATVFYDICSAWHVSVFAWRFTS